MEKGKTIAGFRLHESDTGSADVQVALLTERINHLTEHLQKNIKDHGSRRGLLKMVGQRRRLLDYLHQTDLPRYQTVTKRLKLRHWPLFFLWKSPGPFGPWLQSIAPARKRDQAGAQMTFAVWISLLAWVISISTRARATRRSSNGFWLKFL